MTERALAGFPAKAGPWKLILSYPSILGARLTTPGPSKQAPCEAPIGYGPTNKDNNLVCGVPISRQKFLKKKKIAVSNLTLRSPVNVLGVRYQLANLKLVKNSASTDK